MSKSGIRDIVIAGGGSAGWMAAAALGRFLGHGHRLTLVESDAIGTVGVGEATIPQIHLFNASLGIDEREFVAATSATFKLGIEFAGWVRPDHRYMHAFGVVGRGSGLIPFRQLWLRARAAGVAGPYGDYSFNETAARAGRMGRGNGQPGPVPDLAYAYHFDAALYAGFLRQLAEAAGVTRIEGKIERVERDPASGDIAALHLEADRRVAGDLFIDCTGFRSLLVGETLGTPFEDWSRYLPCDRALAMPCARSDAFRPYTQSLARAAGWQWRIPLQHRTGNGHVYSSAHLSDDEAERILRDNLDGEPLGDPRPIKFTSGRRTMPWTGNAIALGLAAGFMEPLESTSIHLVQSGIARLLTMLPASEDWSAERDLFNRLSATEWERIRDMIVLHYHANERVGEAFWDDCRAMPIPDTLAQKIAAFRASGTLVREADELFTEEGWAQVLIGQSVLPAGASPLTDGLEPAELQGYLAAIADAGRRKAANLPTHAEFVAALTRGQLARMSAVH
nr:MULTISPECIES: tryptophan halogenase family protein [Sphingomonas]